MSTNWVCPIDGCLPADNGTNTATINTHGANAASTYDYQGQPTVAGSSVALTAAALGDYWAQPVHCPVCGSGMIVSSATVVTAATGVASGSQVPADLDATYVVATDSPEAQFGATVYTRYGDGVYPHAFSVLSRGTATVTAETINSVVGP